MVEVALRGVGDKTLRAGGFAQSFEKDRIHLYGYP